MGVIWGLLTFKEGDCRVFILQVYLM
jgi:hypothetical protein